MIATATELKIHGVCGLFRFFSRMGAIRRQLGSAEGVLFVRLRGFRTLTGWSSPEAMKAFRNSGAHLDAMKHLASIGKAKSVTWETQQEPSWAEAVSRLKAVEF
jgi:hypothetical protein